jgi:two-component system nitrogen regulation sensor histidine kinase GlnL
MDVPKNYKTDNKLEQLATSVVLIDDNYRIKYINSSAEILFQVSLKKVINKTIQEIFDDIDYLEYRIKKSIDRSSTYKEHECGINVKQKTKTVTFTVTPINNEDYSFILEFVEMDQVLQVAKEERMMLQQKANSELLRNLAHEIRNPLGGIKGSAQLLSDELKNEYTDYIQVIISESERLQKLMDKLLSPHKIPKFEKHNIHETLEKLRNTLSSQYPKIKFVRDYDISIPEISCDSDKIYQALFNIVKNAAEAITDGKEDKNQEIIMKTRPERKVIFHKKLHRTVVNISIQDNGPGIPVEKIEEIFFPLVTLKTSGTGIGLSLSQNFITLHNGIIDVTSEPSQTVFKVLLPIEEKNNET